jgi:hypothetical protein
MSDSPKFPKTMAALANVEGSLWGLADALVAEVETTTSGNAKAGQYEAIAKQAVERGFVNPSSGQGYSAPWLAKIRDVGFFTNSLRTERLELRKHPVSRVWIAKSKAKGDPVKTLEILASGKTMTEIEGRTLVTGVKTEEQVRSLVKSASPELRKAMIEEALIDPDVAREVASDEKIQDTIFQARLDAGYRAQTGKSFRPTPAAPREEEDEGPIRPGIAFLYIGESLYKARVELITAIRHVQESDVTDSLRQLLTADIDTLRELLVDLQLAVLGEKEISDEDLEGLFRTAKEDNANWKEVK